MRKALLVTLSLALAVALVATAVTAAGGSTSTDSKTPAAAPQREDAAFVRAARQEQQSGGARHHHRRGHHRRALRSLATRLDVSPQQLRVALHTVRNTHGADLMTLWRKRDLAQLKQKLADLLGAELNKSPDEILQAVRAELEAKLDRAERAGWISDAVRTQALGCFDDPAGCDLAKLRGAMGFMHHRR